jgi:hypothetical protein
MARGRDKTALDRAKDLHKAHQNSASESLLLDAYVARIRSLSRQNLHLEAKSLLDLVRQRYPSAEARLAEAADSAAARAGEFDGLLRSLADPGVLPERRAFIERLIEQNLCDLPALAESSALPPDHPLPSAAAALQKAFTAVTSGPVAEETLALTEVPHRSPLAPWKLLIRAIGCFYRGDDEACRRYLDAIKAGSAPELLAPAIRRMLDGGVPEPAAPAAMHHLISEVTGGNSILKRSFEQLDKSFADSSESRIVESIRTAIRECSTCAPDLVTRLRQHICVRAATEDLDTGRVTSAAGGPPAEDAYFYRLLARTLETSGDRDDIVRACKVWNDFRTAALQERWFRPNGTEVAALYLHMAALLRRLPPGFLDMMRFPKAKKARADDLYCLQPDKLYERACALDPHSDAFAQWFAWAEDTSFWQGQQIAQAWHKAVPDDIEPLLHLVKMSERTGAFHTALGHLDEAERIDSLHTVVRSARLRLLAREAMSQLQRKNPALAAETLDKLAALPEAQQGDRPALIAAMRYVMFAVAGDSSRAAVHRESTESLLGSRLAASILISGIAAGCRRAKFGKLPPLGTFAAAERTGLPAAIARAAVLGREVRLEWRLPGSWLSEAVQHFPTAAHSLDGARLHALAEAALRSGNTGLAYLVSAAGLERGGADEPAFLLLRARALPPRDALRRVICAAAAAELARHIRNVDVAGQALDFIRGELKTAAPPMSRTDAESVLGKEKRAQNPPKANDRGPDYSDFTLQQCDCPGCRRARGEDVEDEEEEEEEEDSDFEEIFDEVPVPREIPPQIARVLFEEATQAAKRGESIEEMIARLMGRPAPRRRKKGRRI